MLNKNFISNFMIYSKELRWVLIWNFIYCLAVGIHLILYNLYLNLILQDQVQIGNILAVSSIMQAIVFIPAGFLADKIGARKGILISLVILIIGFLGNITITSESLLYLWGILIGVGNAGIAVMFVPILTEFSKSEEQGTLFSFAFGTGSFAMFLGTLIGGNIAGFLQWKFNLDLFLSYKMTFIVMTSILILCSFPLLIIKEVVGTDARNNLSLTSNKPIAGKGYLMTIVKFGIYKILSGLGIGLIIPFTNLLFLNRFDLSAAKISVVMALATLITVWFMSLNPRLVRLMGNRLTVTLFHFISIPTILLLGFTHDLWLGAIAFIIYRAAKFTVNPIESKVMIDQVPPSKKGLANSVGFVANTIAVGVVGPLCMYLVSVFGDYKGYLFACIITAAFGLISGLYFYFSFYDKREENSLKSQAMQASQNASIQ